MGKGGSMERPKNFVEFKHFYRLNFSSLENAKEYYKNVRKSFPHFCDCRNEEQMYWKSRFIYFPKSIIGKEELIQLVIEWKN
jgi:hypothetical protein